MKHKKFKKSKTYVNRSIRASEVRCIDQNDVNHGVIPFNKALNMAEEAGLDLIQVSYAKNQPPACKILDYGKYKYNMSKKVKEQNKKQREAATKVKEVKIRPNTEINDLQTKARQIFKFFQDGCRVKVVVRFKRHELRHPEVGYDKYYEFLETLEKFIEEQDVELEVKPCAQIDFSGKMISTVWEATEKANA